MRRFISVLLVLTGLFTIITGIWNFFLPFSRSFSPGHAVGASIFGALCIIHALLNWKSIMRYFKTLRWWWLWVTLGLIATVIIAVIPLLHM
jgi:hypothetical protein